MNDIEEKAISEYTLLCDAELKRIEMVFTALEWLSEVTKDEHKHLFYKIKETLRESVESAYNRFENYTYTPMKGWHARFNKEKGKASYRFHIYYYSLMLICETSKDGISEVIANLPNEDETQKALAKLQTSIDDIQEKVTERFKKDKSTKAKQSKDGEKAYRESERAERDKVNKARLERAYKACYTIFETGTTDKKGNHKPPYHHNGKRFEKAYEVYLYVIEHFEMICGKDDKTGKFGGKLEVKWNSLKTKYHAYVRNLKAKGKNHESN